MLAPLRLYVLSTKAKLIPSKAIYHKQTVTPGVSNFQFVLFFFFFSFGQILNHPNTTCYQPGDQSVCAADLESHEVHRDDALIDAKPDKKFYIAFDTFQADTNLLFSENGYVRYMSKWDVFFCRFKLGK